MGDKVLTAHVTVTYKCPNFVNERELRELYNNNPLECYKCVSDDFRDEPFNFGDLVEESIQVVMK